MKKKILLLIGIIGLCFGVNYAQEEVYERRGSGLYFELLGNGGVYSINYESRLSNQNRGLGARLGIAYGQANGDPAVAVPVMLNYLIGKPEGKHFLEIGAGVTYFGLENVKVGVNDKDVFFRGDVYGTFAIMYHRHPPFGGFMWKIGFTPLIGEFENHGNFLGWIGFGAGYAF